jgi:hypothetical protein
MALILPHPAISFTQPEFSKVLGIDPTKAKRRRRAA